MADLLLNKIVVSAPLTISKTVVEAPINIAKIAVSGPVDIGGLSIVAPIAISTIVINAPLVIGETNSTGTATYTGTAERNVGGISDGQVFSMATMTEMWDSLIKEEKFPSLSAPSSTFSSSATGYREIGEIISNINFTASFNRGVISPQYSALSPYRSGVPTQYNYTGSGLANNPSTSLSDTQTITGYTVTLGTQSWGCSVSYAGGVQPKSSYDNDYNAPLTFGSTSTKSQAITGVYPFYSTTLDIAVLTKQPLASMSSSYVQTNMAAEDGANKQISEFPQAWNAITGVQFFNTVSSSWEWLGGSQTNSLSLFDKTVSIQTIQGSTVDYWRYTNNGATVGARQLRWYTT